MRDINSNIDDDMMICNLDFNAGLMEIELVQNENIGMGLR
jgi:hypothetical protein